MCHIKSALAYSLLSASLLVNVSCGEPQADAPQASVEASPQALSGLWGNLHKPRDAFSPFTDVTFCFRGALATNPAYATIRAAFIDAAAVWTAATDGRLSIVVSPICGAGIAVVAEDIDAAGRANNVGRGVDLVTIDPVRALDNPTAPSIYWELRGTSMHEIGHALGFTHEANHDDSTCSKRQTWDWWFISIDTSTVGDDPWAYDPNSIMNYCAHRRDLSPGDRRAVRRLYGGNGVSVIGGRKYMLKNPSGLVLGVSSSKAGLAVAALPSSRPMVVENASSPGAVVRRNESVSIRSDHGYICPIGGSVSIGVASTPCAWDVTSATGQSVVGANEAVVLSAPYRRIYPIDRWRTGTENGRIYLTTYGTPEFIAGASAPSIEARFAWRFMGPMDRDVAGPWSATDVMLTGGPGWNTLPIASSASAGPFRVFNSSVGAFGAWATSDAYKLVGDFDGNGASDVALVGGPGWTTLPVAYSNSDGSFRVENPFVDSNFVQWARQARYRLVGDFDGDGRSDIALVGGPWNSIPVAFGRGNNAFEITANGVWAFPYWAREGAAEAMAADFDGDGRSDILLTGVNGWTTLPVARSLGDGSFSVTNSPVGVFGQWSSDARQRILGDFNGDGKWDLALTGGSWWLSVPVAMSLGDGNFSIHAQTIDPFPNWSEVATTRLAGDFNGDGRTDIALMGNGTWRSIPIAFSNGYGGFWVTKASMDPNADVWSTQAKQRVAGDFNRDGVTDIALIGNAAWTTLPVLLSNSDGSFRVVNEPVGDFQVWAQTAPSVLPGSALGQ